MTVQKTLSTRAWAELLLLALIWGGSFLAYRLALAGVGVPTIVAFRVIGAASVLWLYVLGRGLPVPRGLRIWGVFLVMGLLNNAIPFSLIAWGEIRIASGLAAILNASTAILGVLVAAALFRDERLTARKAAGVMLGFLGVASVIGLDALKGMDLTSLSQLAVLGAAFSYALSAAFARHALKGIRPQVAAAGMLTGSSAMMLPMALFFDGVPSFSYAPSVWGGLLYLALAASAFAYLLYYRVLAMAGAGNVSQVTLLVAPVGILLGALVLGERLAPSAYLGFVLITAGLIVLDGRLLRRLLPARAGSRPKDSTQESA